MKQGAAKRYKVTACAGWFELITQIVRRKVSTITFNGLALVDGAIPTYMLIIASNVGASLNQGKRLGNGGKKKAQQGNIPPKFNSSPLKMDQRKVVFQSSFFRAYLKFLGCICLVCMWYIMPLPGPQDFVASRDTMVTFTAFLWIRATNMCDFSCFSVTGR